MGASRSDEAASFKVDHAHDHGAPGIKRQIDKTPPGVEGADVVVDRMGDDAEAADLARCPQSRGQCKKQERSRVALTVIGLVDRKLAEKRGRDRIRRVALLRPGKELTLDLGRAQRHVADNLPRCAVTNDVRSRNAGYVVAPGKADKPSVERFAATVELGTIVGFGERAG